MKKQDKKKAIPPIPPEAGHSGAIQTDPQGSYTGRPEELWEVPVQDVDDL